MLGRPANVDKIVQQGPTVLAVGAGRVVGMFLSLASNISYSPTECCGQKPFLIL